MTKITKHIFILLTTAYFMFAGTGYNVVKLCHTGCTMMSKQFVDSTTTTTTTNFAESKSNTHSCCKKKHTKSPDKCCKQMHMVNKISDAFSALSKTEKECLIIRASVETPTEVVPLRLNNTRVKCIELYINTLEIKEKYKDRMYAKIYPPPEFEFQLKGREILALKSVLII